MATTGKKKVDASEPKPDIDDWKEHQTPPLKPFIKSESRNLDGLRSQLVQPAVPQHFGGIPGIPRSGEGVAARFDDIIEISSSGIFKGSAKVETAQINGCFDGKLEVKGVLRIQKDGRVSGSVRYGKIVIESGGEISGDMASFNSPNGSAKPSDKN